MTHLPTIAYISNEFPSAVEWYVVEEIRELRRRGVQVIPCSSRSVDTRTLPWELREFADETLSLEPLHWKTAAGALFMCMSRFSLTRHLIAEALLGRHEAPTRRARMLLHTFLGAYYALLLRNRGVEHIHVHHGYFSSWIAMVAARFLGIPFSMTLHGSDLLLNAVRMGTKLGECEFCLTVSEFNRRHILAHYPAVDPGKVLVQQLGVEIPATTTPASASETRPLRQSPLLLAVGRLHPVKNHAFLLQACFLLRECGVQFRCLIVGEGPERQKLEFLIRELKIGDVVTLVGHVPRGEIDPYYERADLVVLTSHSEGIPLVLMEAMARGKIVLAPAITGIPELIVDGKTGFLYTPGALEQFVWQVEQICTSLDALESMRRLVREHVRVRFDQRKNMERFADVFLQRITPGERSGADEDLVLQQI